MKKTLYILAALMLILAASCSDSLDNVTIEEMLSDPDEGSLALISMNGDTSTRDTEREPMLTVFTNGNYIPLIFRLSNNKIVSLETSGVITVDNYIIATISGVVIYKTRIDERNITDYITGNIINCRFEKEHFNTTILIDTENGHIVDLKDLNFEVMEKGDPVGITDDYLFLPRNNWNDNYEAKSQVARISRSNINSAKVITSSLKNASLRYILGDYILTVHDGSEAYSLYLIDGSEPRKEYTFTAPELILLPKDKNTKKAWILQNKNDDFEEMSTGKGSFVKTGQVSDGPGDYILSLRVDMNNPSTPGITRPYDCIVTLDDFQSRPFMFRNKYESMGNLFINNKGYVYFKESDGKLTKESRTFETFSHLDEVKNLPTTFSGNCPMYLFFDGENLYFLNNENHIACLNILTGEYDKSTYTIELESAENSYMTLSGTQLIYRVETSGSGYVTKSVDITNLRKSPVTVNYSPTDVISIPDFRF